MLVWPILKLTGLQLPLEEYSTTLNCLEIYESWITNIATRPIAISENEQLFFQLAFQHISCVFECRGKVSSLVQAKHIDICRKAIKIYLNAARQYGKSFNSLTWTVLLKMLLGICDYLLRDNPSSYLTEQLIEIILWTFFEIWLRSSVIQIELWTSLEVLLLFYQRNYFPNGCINMKL